VRRAIVTVFVIFLPVLAKLEALPTDKFQPKLELLEQLINSLEERSK
jgi:hypothetical protein